MPRHVWLELTFIALLITAARCLRNVRLEVIPEVVEHGHETTLRCYYDLQGVDLYSLKWYRGNYEFYRYSPSETPVTKIFNFSWIEVDPSNSNQSQVTIQNVDFPLGGNFSCEVTADGPLFSTASSSKTLTVVSVPKSKPLILSERRHYEPGDILRANCSTSSSRPPVQLSFTLNDLQVENSVTMGSFNNQSKHDRSNDVSGIHNYDRHHHQQQQQQQQQQVQEQDEEDDPRQRIELYLHLQPFHFVNGQLNLRCKAVIPNIYEQISELQLGSSRLREPIPERVTSGNAGYEARKITKLTMAFLILLQLHLR